MLKAWLAYAAVGLAVTVAGAGIASVLVDRSAVAAVWFAGGLAYVLQLAAFAGLVAVRERPEMFLVGWLAGMVMRFGAVGIVAAWLSRSDALPMTPALLSLVAFVFMLLLLEPLFLRRGLQAK